MEIVRFRFAVGDWYYHAVNSMPKNSGDRRALAKQAFEHVGVTVRHIRDWASVAARISLNLRRDNVAWSFYRTLGTDGVPDRVRADYLRRLPEAGLTVKKVREEVVAEGYLPDEIKPMPMRTVAEEFLHLCGEPLAIRFINAARDLPPLRLSDGRCRS